MQERGNIPPEWTEEDCTEDAATRLSEQQKCEKSHAIPAGFLPVPESKISCHSPGNDDRWQGQRSPVAVLPPLFSAFGKTEPPRSSGKQG